MVALRVRLAATRTHANMHAAIAAVAGLCALAAVCIEAKASRLSVWSHKFHAHGLRRQAHTIGIIIASAAFSSLLLTSASLLLGGLVPQTVLKVVHSLQQPGCLRIVLLAAALGA